MAGYKVSLNVNRSSFPEIGVPGYPVKATEVKTSKANKEDYKVYTQGCSMINKDSKLSAAFTPDNFKMEFPLNTEVTKTYKFLGMDIDADFNAVINIPSGQVVVGPMYSSEVLENIYDNILSNRWGLEDADKEIILSTLRSMSKDDVRRLATSMKTGMVYDSNKNNEDGNKAVDITAKMIDYVTIESGEVFNAIFKSIILSMVKKQQNVVKKVQNQNRALSDKDIAGIVLKIVFSGWEFVLGKYNEMYSTLCCLDVWSDCQKKITGTGAFSSRMASAIDIVSLDDGSLDAFKMVSFNGLSKNGGMVDSNVLRENACAALNDLSNLLGGGNMSSSFDMVDLMLGFIDDTGIDNVYDLSPEEIQALSVLDSLAYIDEDAALIKDTYDMSDPEERGLYVKSVIKSYERNFKDFKPAAQYDVNEVLAEMVEKGDTITAPMVTSENGVDVSIGDVVTSTESDIKVENFKNDLKKVLKLLDKSVKRINKGF